MAKKESHEPLAPTMQRTKIQLETSYAPGVLFTFEGNLVVCESIPKDEYRSAVLNEYAEIQILNGIEERVTAWFDAAMRSENDPKPFMCVDSDFLNDNESGLKDSFRRSLFGFAEPGTMGYTPTLLTMVCSRCKRVKTFSSLNDFYKRKGELSPDNCTSNNQKGNCQWRQMDIVFIHPNGNYKAPVPWVYDYSKSKNGVIRAHERCSHCGTIEVCIEEKSAQIGKRYYYCANPACKMKRGKGDRWLQNDDEWLNRFGNDSNRPFADIRMKPISSRSNAVHYTMQDMIIDFGKSERLASLTDATSNALIQAVAERFNLPTIEPDIKMIKKEVIDTRGEKEWSDYESLLRNVDGMEELKAKMPESNHEHINASINVLKEKISTTRSNWQKKGIFPAEAKVPPKLLKNLTDRKKIFSSRYDPFRLLIEHSTLLERIVSDQRMENGMRHFTQLDRLDEYIGPDDEEERSALNNEHRKIMDVVGIATMGLIRKFETLQYSYGYTRVASTPTTRYINDREVPVRLKLFSKTRIDDQRKHPIFVLKQNNEAIYVHLNEKLVRKWLLCIGTQEVITDDPIGQQYLENVPRMSTFLDDLPGHDLLAPSMALAVYTLIHTYLHHVMMGISEFSGLGTGSLGGYIFPADLSFIVYRRGMTMDMGNLTSMLRNNAPAFLKYMANRRNLGCGSGSLCLKRGGACPDCLLIPEVSCLTQNKLLSRTVLIGKDHPGKFGFNKPIVGFLDLAKESL